MRSEVDVKKDKKKVRGKKELSRIWQWEKRRKCRAK